MGAFEFHPLDDLTEVDQFVDKADGQFGGGYAVFCQFRLKPKLLPSEIGEPFTMQAAIESRSERGEPQGGERATTEPCRGDFAEIVDRHRGLRGCPPDRHQPGQRHESQAKRELAPDDGPHTMTAQNVRSGHQQGHVGPQNDVAVDPKRVARRGPFCRRSWRKAGQIERQPIAQQFDPITSVLGEITVKVIRRYRRVVNTMGNVESARILGEPLQRRSIRPFSARE